MKDKQEYINDIAEMRSLMERSTKFLSLSGMAGIMAGLYALSAAFIVVATYDFNPQTITYYPANTANVVTVAVGVLVLAVGTAIFLSSRKAGSIGEKLWNPTAKRMITSMLVPLLAGGILILYFISNSMAGILAPLTLVFYGLALYSAGKYTYKEVKSLGLIQVCLGLLSCMILSYSILIWAIGFGIVHIIYGIYMHYRYEG